MSMVTNTLGRYFAGRFVVSAIGVFASIFLLLVLVDYIEMVRRTSGLLRLLQRFVRDVVPSAASQFRRPRAHGAIQGGLGIPVG